PTAAQVRDRLVPDGCIKDINCTVVIPFGPEPAGTPGKVPATPPWYKAVRAMEDQDGGSHLGFAGTQGWATYSVDLGRWAGQRVWLGFYFASSPLLNPRTYFSSPTYFNQTAGFYGFQMDDVVLTAPGPAVSLRVLSPLDEPNDHPDPGQPQRTVVAPGKPFQVRPTLLNTGASAFHAKTHMELRAANGTVITTGDHPAIFMAPGSMARLAFPVPALPAANGYQLRVAAQRVSVSPACPDALSDFAVCAPQPCPDVPQEPGCLPSDPDPANDVLDTTFDVAAIHNLAAGELTRSAPLIPHVGSGSVAFTLPITNRGNQPENVTAAACVVVLQAAPVCGQGPDFFDPQTPGAAAPVLLAPLATHTFQWSAIPAQAGQYRLFVRVATGSVDAVPPFTPADLATLRAPATTASPDFRYRALGLGFGVERSPPAIFAQDFSAGCPAITTDPLLGAPWTRSDELSKDGRTEAWACGPYGPDGKQVLYEGTTDGAHHSELRTFPQGLSLTQVATPAFTIPNILDPYLFLEHQYATESWIVDEAGPTPTGYKDFGTVGSGLQTNGIEVKSRGRVYLDVSYDGGHSWARRYLLQPEDGYTSEEQIGIADPERNGRDGRPALGSIFEVNACDRPEKTGDGIADHVDKGIKTCGFWWPTGLQPLYRPAGSNYTTGATFSGSPWLVDRFPLFGVRVQGVTGDPNGKGTETYGRIVAAGNTARLVLDFARSAPPTANNP
ncbi:MAG TPA: hypothetical protein VM241_02565, partial [Candidatus Thermoplasmatota archaeon]|nr:hypothetical protein [Candidatus Thermoplasmatota archaeon]